MALSLFSLAIGCFISSSLATSDGPLVQPSHVSSHEGLLDTVINFQYSDFSSSAKRFRLSNTRLLNGTLPGPTLRIKPGDTLRILFQNQLSSRSKNKKADQGNLHFHGLHVSGELPSDDVTFSIEPGDSFQYETAIPSDHLPGTHWMHPHVHESTALHLGAGAASVLIVEDEPGSLPTVVAEAPDIVLMIQHFEWKRYEGIAREMGDQVFRVVEEEEGSKVSPFRMVNGQYQPHHSMTANQWERWRIVFGGWEKEPLNMHFDTRGKEACTMALLAKDGIYISDFLRLVTLLPIPTAGRADVMVRCTKAGTYTARDGLDNILFMLQVHNTTSTAAVDLPTNWRTPLPEYLRDLRGVALEEGCRCETRMEQGKHCVPHSDDCINNLPFDPLVYLHQVPLNSVAERIISDIHNHPYHQHTSPFQLIRLGEKETDTPGDYYNDDQKLYFQEGDHHDVLMIEKADATGYATIRFAATTHTGKMMVHCHRLTHEDQGMMAQELIVSQDQPCVCKNEGMEECRVLGMVSGIIMHWGLPGGSGVCFDFCAPRVLDFLTTIMAKQGSC